MTRYNSKIGWGLATIIALVIIGTSIALVLDGIWSGFIISVLVFGFVAHMFATTYYTVNGGDLNIRSGFIYNKTIAIHGITEIAESNNPLSAPATSLDRLEIRFNKGGSVLISPKEKDKFIAHLRTINPSLNVIRK
ncbi:PH domain-containing protein [Flavobacteriaceae bacterium F89]|uniref:PH domain-containing protein n=1 Tax=Cerina litoralis TaxID=2874477 RepID=A0AAE3EX47_9FLAO|nr:PH domain-containing protein [Cerina litoralis]